MKKRNQIGKASGWVLLGITLIVGFQNCQPFDGSSKKQLSSSSFGSADPLPFNSKVGLRVERLLRTRCLSCHDSKETARGSVYNIADSAHLVNSRLIIPGKPDISLLYRSVASRKMPGNGVYLDPFELNDLRTWIENVPDPVESQQGQCSTYEEKLKKYDQPRVWLLTKAQYSRVIQDTFNVKPQFDMDSLPVPNKKNGFSSQSLQLDIGSDNFNKFKKIAIAAAEDMTARGIQNIWPCSNFNPSNKDCRTQFFDEMGGKLFRRPLNSTEMNTLEDLYTLGEQVITGTKESLDSNEGFKLALTYMFLSPHFLYRQEFGGFRAESSDGNISMSQYELAGALSLTIWNSTPDDELFDLAKSGSLDDPAVVKEQVERMLKDGRAKSFYRTFFQDWLTSEEVAHHKFNDEDLDQELLDDMSKELRVTIDKLVWSQGSQSLLKEVFGTSKTYINQNLAEKIYKTTGYTSTKFEEYEMDPKVRSGLLTLPIVLAQLDGESFDALAIKRGRFVVEDLLCQPLGKPTPPDELTERTLSGNETPRERWEIKRFTDLSCVGCHSKINPTGFGMGDFDYAGRYLFNPGQLTNYEKRSVSDEVKYTLSADGEFKGAGQLSRQIASSEDLSRCFTKKMFRYVFGRMESRGDQCQISKSTDKFLESGGRIQDLVVDYLSSDLFANKYKYQ